MKVWELDSGSKVQITTKDFEADFNVFFDSQFLGSPVEKWKEIEMHIYKGKGVACDSLSFVSGKLIWSKKAIDLLQPAIYGRAEVLPLQLEDFPVAAVNVTNIVDAINHEQSVEKTLSSGTFIGYESYAFHPERLQGEFIFKIPQQLSTKVFVTDAFKSLVESHRLKGFVFHEVFSSEHMNTPQQPAVSESTPQSGEYTYEEAMKIVEEGEWAVVSGDYKWQKNANGKIVLGDKLPDGSYAWSVPVYTPIPMLEMKWKLSSRSIQQ
ncbi:imm11 family protein [Paenibacillus sp. MMO-177]|uniref:imm11 family protein n=1 Tax=Paenibacillus sp. MMO-177 TaxID=3081289 RepID=UPI003018D1C0